MDEWRRWGRRRCPDKTCVTAETQKNFYACTRTEAGSKRRIGGRSTGLNFGEERYSIARRNSKAVTERQSETKSESEGKGHAEAETKSAAYTHAKTKAFPEENCLGKGFAKAVPESETATGGKRAR